MFEELINSLLKEMGFETELTSKSGDGGVDIIARYNEPIFKGKYLIQCKYWTNQVGEPPIRDLYGVCLSENANKGVLITNSGFTDNAMRFAEGKNLELIDGNILRGLLEKYSVNIGDFKNNADKPIHFTNMNNFNLEKYRYLISRVEGDRREVNHYKNLQKFFFDNLISKDYEILKSGLLDEFIGLNEEYIRRFCKKNKVGITEKESLSYLNALLFLYKGKLFKAIEILRDIGMLNQPSPFVLTPYSEITGGIIISHLLIIFKEVGYEDGVEIILKMLDDTYNLTYRQINSGFVTILDLQEKENNYKKWLKEFNLGKEKKIYIPSGYSVYKLIDYHYKMYWNNNNYFDITELITDMWEIAEVTEDLKKMKVLLS